MLLMIDNYDSFTYNLVQYLEQLGQSLLVFRNDEISLDGLQELSFDGLVISPGPGAPVTAGISLNAIRHCAGRVPILGVCLGHQAIGAAFGAEIVRARSLVHGKTTPVFHDQAGVFAGIPTPFAAGRYHSLALHRETLPGCLKVSAWTEDGEIMGVRHRDYPIEGVQFHPESILTPLGMGLLKNFTRSCRSGSGLCRGHAGAPQQSQNGDHASAL